MSHLPCPSCLRHVRAGEIACPFCDAALASRTEALPSQPGPRLGRIAVLAAGAALMAGASSCDDNITPKTGTGGAAAAGGKGGGGASGAGGAASGGASGSGGAAGGASGSGGAAARDGGTDVPVAIYAAAVALPSNQA